MEHVGALVAAGKLADIPGHRALEQAGHDRQGVTRQGQHHDHPRSNKSFTVLIAATPYTPADPVMPTKGQTAVDLTPGHGR